MKEKNEAQKPPLARWATIAQSASLSTKTGGQRFLITIKLPEKSLKTATSFTKELNDALETKIETTSDCDLAASFVLVDSERARLQRATASFTTFKEAQTCCRFLKELGLPVNEISPELEDFGNKQYDPWHARVSQAWWPWLAAWRNPPPDMPMMKVTNRLDVAQGSKYKEGASGKLGSVDEADRDAAPPQEKERGGKKRKKDRPRKEDGPV